MKNKQVADFTGQKVLVLVPHQDDELIGMGGQVSAAARTAKSCRVVLMTDGAADGGSKSMVGLERCSRLSELPGCDCPELRAHDATLVNYPADNAWYHSRRDFPPFGVMLDEERVTGFECPAWGILRCTDFFRSCEALGVERENVYFSYWDPECPISIKDGQCAFEGRPLSDDARVWRYHELAAHYIQRFLPDVILTMAPYEAAPPPNDHWACAHGVTRAARAAGIRDVRYAHSSYVYKRMAAGENVDEYADVTVPLTVEMREAKMRACREYLRWDPARGHFATAAHSVPLALGAIMSDAVQCEVMSLKIAPAAD